MGTGIWTEGAVVLFFRSLPGDVEGEGKEVVGQYTLGAGEVQVIKPFLVPHQLEVVTLVARDVFQVLLDSTDVAWKLSLQFSSVYVLTLSDLIFFLT